MLQRLTIYSRIFILIFALLISFSSEISAQQTNKNVIEWIQQPEEQNDENNTPSRELDQNESELTTSSNQFSAWEFIKMIFATIFIIALIYFVLKLINKKNRLFNKDKYIENIGGTSLGTNRSIQLVKVGDRILVVGVGDSIQLLKEIDDSEEIKEILEEHNTRLDHLVQPRDLLTKLVSHKKNKTKGNADQFQSILKEQLTEISKGRKKMLDEFSKKGSSKE
ncbi:flagellar biosynthetic protein FliO [Cytobacillus sp. S13-E01]|uniref:flagellar biosynthetic protein FliO n=1 Tax=Cytobacillus sp. S13-E01 TaxID=3031326 RepID=UPI0023D7FDE9|nr:flagellar biosynthetic protein FliO [Cytobacillus sp. S13-E01]MDF0725175.1 flagellar biosynthetic protein FliO [Cytobacillus sp. S13-E01]